MKCFYHKSDFDGKCSAAIIKTTYPECELYGVDYKDKLVGNGIWRNVIFNAQEVVWVVDFCFDNEDMDFLNTNQILHWIDHHATSIENAHKRGFIATGGQSLEVGKAACELVWEYLHPEKEMPFAVHWLGRYDVWDHSEWEVLPFQYGMRHYHVEATAPERTEFWWYLLTNDKSAVNEIIDVGKIIKNYQDAQNSMVAKSMSWETEFHGHKALVMNRSHCNSKVFDAVYDPDKHDIMIFWACKGPDEFKYSLFCDKPGIHVGEIAKQYGGGGHAGAAGFYSKKYLFEPGACKNV